MGLFGFGSIGSGDVVARGRCDSAQVTGIVVGGVSGRRKAIDYALRVGAPQPFTAGVRLGAEPPVVVRLGTTLQVLHLETQVVIDWLEPGGPRSGGHVLGRRSGHRPHRRRPRLTEHGLGHHLGERPGDVQESARLLLGEG